MAFQCLRTGESTHKYAFVFTVHQLEHVDQETDGGKGFHRGSSLRHVESLHASSNADGVANDDQKVVARMCKRDRVYQTPPAVLRHGTAVWNANIAFHATLFWTRKTKQWNQKMFALTIDTAGGQRLAKIDIDVSPFIKHSGSTSIQKTFALQPSGTITLTITSHDMTEQ